MSDPVSANKQYSRGMRLHTSAVALLVIAVQAIASTPDADKEVADVIQTNRQLFERLPMYTCLETISRLERSAKQRKPHVLDTVQVDVGVGANQEIYSWPGERIFSSEDLGNLVGHGFLGTGFFAGFPKNLFLSNFAIVRLASDRQTGGHTDHFTYTIPSLMNHWIVNWLGVKGTVGESGEFWVDENSRTLIRLRATAQDIPPQLPLREFTVSIAYQTLPLNNRSVLLPSTAELVAVEWNGTSHINSIGYSRCQVFGAESKLSESGETLVKAVENFEGKRGTLPGGLDITIRFENGIRGDTAKIGDLILARAVKPVRHAGQVIVPQNATVSGRIREYRRLPDLPYVQVGIEFNEVQIPGHVSSFFAQPVNLPPGVETSVARGVTRPMHAAGSIPLQSITEEGHPIEIPGVATFFLRGSQTLPKGSQMTWRTQKQRFPSLTTQH